MTYILNKTNGSIVATVRDGSIDQSTDLIFVGKNYAGYGEIVNENLLKLLENFSSKTSPARAISGQLWYDSANRKLKIYDGTRFKTFSTTETSTTQPKDLKPGDFWFNNAEEAVYVKTSTGFTLVGPSAGGAAFSLSTVLDSSLTKRYVIKMSINGNVVSLVSNEEFTLSSTDPLYGPSSFTLIKAGINLNSTNAATGNSADGGYYFWGSAANTVLFDDRPVSDFVLKSDAFTTNNITTGGAAIPGTVTGDWSLTAGSKFQATYS